MNGRLGAWRGVVLPSAVVLFAVVLLLVANLLDLQPPGTAREMALVIGSLALTIFLPLGLIWLAVALVLHYSRR